MQDGLSVGAQGVAGAQGVEQEGGVAVDDGEQIVEVVGDAAGQLAHTLQSLGLDELSLQAVALGLGAAALRHVDADAGEIRLAVEFHAHGGDQHGYALAGLLQQHRFGNGLTACQTLPHARRDDGLPLVVVPVEHVEVVELLGRIAGKQFVLLVPTDQVAVGVVDVEHAGHAVHDGVGDGPLAPRGGFGGPLLSDVGDDRGEAVAAERRGHHAEVPSGERRARLKLDHLLGTDHLGVVAEKRDLQVGPQLAGALMQEFGSRLANPDPAGER